MTAIILYIHIPFCRYRCDYCDFFTRTHVAPDRQLRIIERTISHALHSLHRWYPPDAPISSMYVGGGTPSSVHEKARHRLLQGIRECIEYGTLVPDSEITVEVNPEDVDRTLLQDLDRSGVNRISLGVQSLRASTLTRIGRHTTLPATRRGLELIAGTWHRRWSMDVISAIPGQSVTDAAEDVRSALEYHPHHVSLYELGIEPGTRLALTQKRGALPPESEEHRLAQLAAAAEVLAEADFHRYEVSSFSVPGDESRHNLAYWQMHPWAAAGPGAVALLPYQGQATHFTTNHRFPDYLDRDDYAVTPEPLTPRELCEEYLMGGFRMTRGISNATMQHVFGHTLPELLPATLRRWSRYLQYRGNDLVTLTDEGRLRLNRFLVDAFGELERSAELPTAPRWPETTGSDANTDTTAT
ncbi:MAG: radical SAM family heme chaperone HemW [Alkalispirochaeta sp.]